MFPYKLLPLDKDPLFFNTNFSKNKENNLYFAYNSIIYKMRSDESLEILLVPLVYS